MASIRVLIADDHEVVRQGLKLFLGLQDDIEVVGEAVDGLDAVERARGLQPDVVLLDLVMPRMGGIEALGHIREASPQSKVIVLTSFADDDKVFPSVEAGAAGYLLKDVRPQELADAIRSAHRGEAQLHPAVAARLMQDYAEGGRRGAPDQVTERELDVLRLLARGMSNKEIAGALVVSEKTVKTHVSNILHKLGLADRTQAALYAVKQGLAEAEQGET